MPLIAFNEMKDILHDLLGWGEKQQKEGKSLIHVA